MDYNNFNHRFNMVVVKMRTKNGFIFTTAMLIVVAVILLLLLVGGGILIWLLSANVWRIAGLLLLVGAILSYTKVFKFRIPEKVLMIMLVGGLVLIGLTFVSDSFNQPLSVLF